MVNNAWEDCQSNCPSEFSWVDASNGQIPRGAEKVAFFDGDTFYEPPAMYLARAEHDGGIYPGTFLPEEGVVDITVGGEVISKSEYQV